jgi:hypothetical protein
MIHQHREFSLERMLKLCKDSECYGEFIVRRVPLISGGKECLFYVGVDVSRTNLARYSYTEVGIRDTFEDAWKMAYGKARELVSKNKLVFATIGYRVSPRFVRHLAVVCPPAWTATQMCEEDDDAQYVGG